MSKSTKVTLSDTLKVEYVKGIIEEITGISILDIFTKNRKREVVMLRKTFFKLCKDRGVGPSAIAGWSLYYSTKGVDHSTVISHLRKFEEDFHPKRGVDGAYNLYMLCHDRMLNEAWPESQSTIALYSENLRLKKQILELTQKLSC